MYKSCALDYSNFDNSLPLAFTSVVYNCIAQCYKEEWRSAIRASCVESTNHFYLVDGHVYQASQGNPSGHFLTTILNSLTNTLIFFYAWCILCEKNLAPELRTLSGFRESVNLVTYGDDLIFSVTEDATFLNGVSFGETIAHLGVTATNADKSGELTKWTEKRDLTFLKRSFVLGSGCFEKQYIGVLPKSIIEEIPMWRWEDSPPEALKCTIESTLQESRLHGKEYFDSVWKKLCSLQSKQNVDLISHIDIFEVERRVTRETHTIERKIIFFNSRDPEHGWLSNFHPCKIESRGLVFDSLEHAYVYEKLVFHNQIARAKRVFEAKTGAEVKKIGKIRTKDAWTSKKCFVMRELLFTKFALPDLKTKLLETVGYGLVEATPDLFWGAGAWTEQCMAAKGRYPGANALGKALEVVRDHLRVISRDKRQ
jgi:hypothetical protein